jgi:N-alpha-acetyl-L-2,4-diaminobutyrate deacetylase
MNHDDQPSIITSTIDWDAPGRQVGHLNVPHSSELSAWGVLRVPVACIRGGEGPTFLVTAGNHGDEYEGPVAVQKLWRSLSPDQLSGRVILMPALNLPALLEGKRLSPIDGQNMNRVFPGDPRGSITRRIADYVTRELVARADIALDMHSGGKSLNFIPSAIVHELDDAERMTQTMAALEAFRAPVGLVIEELEPEGTLDTLVESRGKLFLSTELGGAGMLTPETVRIAERGLRNLLVHFGLVEGQIEGPATRLMAVPDTDHYVLAEDDGIFEPTLALGESVEAGQCVGRIHFPATPEREPTEHRAERGGVVFCLRPLGGTKRGDCLLVIARDRD